MKAMVFAAGLGGRLRPLTDHRPKALVEVAGRTLLEIALERLRAFGVHEVMVNVHHYADMIVAYLAANQNFGMHIEISREQTLLNTGGGLKQARRFFLGPGGNSEEAFFVHNVDVISSIDLSSLMEFHTKSAALATLAVQQRRTSRYLLFDNEGQLRGRGKPQASRFPLIEKVKQLCNSGAGPADAKDDPAGSTSNGLTPLAFCGIHVVSPRLFAKMSEVGAFSIVDTYVRVAAEGERILAYRADDAYWRDLGRPESLKQAARDIESGLVNGRDSVD
jgi:NDP-sugar pyrophosphorylase family protein